MILAAMLAIVAATPAEWVPMRWPSGDAATLEILKDSPVNALLLERAHWNAALLERAQKQSVATFAVIRPGPDAAAAAQQAEKLPFTGIAWDGDFGGTLPAASKMAIHLGLRSQMKFNSPEPITGTHQGVWPGVRAQEEGKAHTAASGAAWIDTNAGFLRYARAATGATIWIAHVPPAKTAFPVERYLQAIGDAAMCGARWVLAFDDSFNQKLMAKDGGTLRKWNRVSQLLRFYESHPEWRASRAYGKLALVQSPESGALISGGVLDMIAVKHTPVRPVPATQMEDAALKDALMAVNVDPESLSPAQKEALRNFTRGGGTLLNGPPGWKFPALQPGQITLNEKELEKIDQIWKEMNSMTGRRNLGARLFNVSTMLSSLMASPDQKTLYLHLVNYADYPVEDIAVHLLGQYKKVTLLRPEAKDAKSLELYPIDEGMGLDVAQIGSVGVLVLEPAPPPPH
jgi:hypothetical protein